MAHISHTILNKRIDEAKSLVKIGSIYKHYKFPERNYKVLGFSIQESSEKVCVRYQNVNEENAPEFVRDLDSWLETVSWEGKTIPRFQLVK